MAVQALYLRWRPQTFDDVVGQEHVTYTLRNALLSGRVGHAYLFSGPRGTGKTTTARLLAKAVNCLHDDPAVRPCNACSYCLAVNEGRFLDMIEIDAASHTGVDDVRDLRDRIAFAPNEGDYKIYIIDEVHRFSGAAFDALLKTIEEPPAHAIFVLATTEIHKVPQTIKSRCQRFDFRKLSLDEIIERLALICDQEGIQYEWEALSLVARQATGSMRDAISLLDQLVTGDEMLTLELAQAILGTAANETVQSLTDALIDGDSGRGLTIINHALDAGTDPRQFARQMLSYLRLVMLVQTGGRDIASAQASQEALALIEEHAGLLPKRALLAALNAFNEAESDARGGWQPQLPVELAFLESVDELHAEPESSPAPRRQSGQGAETQTVEPAQQPADEAPQEALPEERDEPPVKEGALTLGDIHGRWEEVLDVSRQYDPTGMIQALLRTATPLSVQGDVLFLQMQGDVLCAKIEDDENREVIEATLKHVYGITLKVRCRVLAGSTNRTDEVDDLIANDDVVSFAVNELGGKVKKIDENEETGQ